MPPLGITGSTGRLGGRVARLLAAAGVEQRLLCRSPERAPDLPGTEVVPATYDDADSVRRARRAPDRAVRLGRRVGAPRRGAPRLRRRRRRRGRAALVYTSFFGAAPDATFTPVRDHFHTEQHVRGSGTYTAIAAGELDGVSDDVRRLTGHDPLSLPDVVARQGGRA